MSEPILTAGRLKKIKKEWQGRLPDHVAMVTPYGLKQVDSILKALERMHAAMRAVRNIAHLDDADKGVLTAALRDTGGIDEQKD